ITNPYPNNNALANELDSAHSKAKTPNALSKLDSSKSNIHSSTHSNTLHFNANDSLNPSNNVSLDSNASNNPHSNSFASNSSNPNSSNPLNSSLPNTTKIYTGIIANVQYLGFNSQSSDNILNRVSTTNANKYNN
ncbi:hypothetical protein, partial [Helicobacter sp. T3_23-1056]